MGMFKTFGFFMVMGFAVGYLIVYRAFRKREKAGVFLPEPVIEIVGAPASIFELAISGFFGFILGYKGVWAAQNWEMMVDRPEAVIFSATGVLWAGIVGAILSIAFGYWEKNRLRLDTPVEKIVNYYPSDRVSELIFVAALWGILGAKVLASVTEWNDFVADPLGSLLSFAGLTWYGGLIGGAIAVFIYAKRKKIPLLHLMDSAAPALILAYGVGRLGCHFSGDGDWGIANLAAKPSAMMPDWLWSYDYPNNVSNVGEAIAGCTGDYCRKLIEPVWPTSVYEFGMSLAIYGILMSLSSKLKVPGCLFAVYLVFNGMERFFIEFYRVTDKVGMGLSQAQFIAIFLMLLGVAAFLFLRSRGVSEQQTVME